MSHLAEQEINQPRKGISKLPINLDVLPPHNLCSYPGKDQPSMLPAIIKNGVNYHITSV